MKRLFLTIVAATVATSAQAEDAYCIKEQFLGVSKVYFTSNVMIYEGSGQVMAKVEKLNSDMYLLNDGEKSTAYQVEQMESAFTLTRVGGNAPSIACFENKGARADALQKLEAIRAENKAKLEAERLEKEKKAAEKREAEKQKQAELEAAAKLAAEKRRDQAIKNGDIYLEYIQTEIENNWRLPSTARNGMSALVEIRLFPNGQVDQANIKIGSGDEAYDRSVLQAIERVRTFQRVAEADPIIFERKLKRVLIQFRPEGIRW